MNRAISIGEFDKDFIQIFLNKYKDWFTRHDLKAVQDKNSCA